MFVIHEPSPYLQRMCVQSTPEYCHRHEQSMDWITPITPGLRTAIESPLVYACELWVFAMCPEFRGSSVSYAGVANIPKHSLEYSLNFWSRQKKKNMD